MRQPLLSDLFAKLSKEAFYRITIGFGNPSEGDPDPLIVYRVNDLTSGEDGFQFLLQSEGQCDAGLGYFWS